jgi:hypothetical protein
MLGLVSNSGATREGGELLDKAAMAQDPGWESFPLDWEIFPVIIDLSAKLRPISRPAALARDVLGRPR